MKKAVKILAILAITFIVLFLCTSLVQAATSQVIDNKTESKLVEMKDKAENSLENYKEKYGSDTYGFVAYILNIVRIYSIPFGFLGITVSAIYQYVVGRRHAENSERGAMMMITMVTLLVICQILPLAFAIVVKFGRG